MPLVELTTVVLESGLKYRLSANQRGKVAWFVHGLGDTPDHFLLTAGVCEQHGFSLVLLDLPGHGINRRIGGRFDDCIAYLEEVHESLGKQVDLLVGHSFGGLVVLVWLARRGGLSVGKTVMIEPSITKADYDFFTLIQEPPDGIGVAVLGTEDPENNYPYHPTYAGNVRASDLPTLKALALDVYRHFAIYQREIHAAKVPFWYVYGGSSTAPEEREKMKEWAWVTVLRIEGAAHWVHLDAPALMRQLL